MDRKFEITDAQGGSAFTVSVVTQSEKSEIVGMQEDGSLKVRLVSSPAGSAEANAELIRLVAGRLAVEESRIEIVAGEDKRKKLISIDGMTTAQVEAKMGDITEA